MGLADHVPLSDGSLTLVAQIDDDVATSLSKVGRDVDGTPLDAWRQATADGDSVRGRRRRGRRASPIIDVCESQSAVENAAVTSLSSGTSGDAG